MATIIKRTRKDGSHSFQARVRVAGYPDEVATFPKRSAAAGWASKVESDRRLARVFPEALAEMHTVSEAIDRYLREITAEEAQRTQHIESKEVKLNWWKAEYGDTKLSNLTAATLSDAKLRLLTSGQKGKRSPATVNRYMAAFSHCLSVAVTEWRWLQVNPFSTFSKLRESQGRVRFLDDAERTALLAACDRERRKPLTVLVMLAISTGARKNELLSLLWRDVDLERGRATLHNTKNGERRSLYITGMALTLLNGHKENAVRGWKHVFPARCHDKPMDIEREWRRAASAAGLVNFRFHDLRHTTASYLAQNGASTAEIADVLGHKTLSMVKRYAHLTEKHTSGVVASMTSKIFGERGDGCNA